MPQKHFLVHGAQCRCDHGAKPDKLAVLSQKKEYINDADGSEKLIANTLDIGVPFEAKTFGACSILDGPCAPAVTAWTDFYKNVKLSNGGNILTEDSKAVCSVSGTPCISILFHGQTAALTAAHFDNVEVDVLALLNPAAPPPDAKKKELPKVKSMKLRFEQRKENKSFSSSANGKGKVQVIVCRKDEPMKFEVENYYNPKTADTAKVGWKVIKAHAFQGETQTFSEAGPTLSLNFDAVGKYRVLAFGNSDESKQNDTACSLDIEVKENTLRDEFKLDSATARRKKDQLFLRRGVATTIEALYEFEPTEEERKRVHMVLTDETGNILQTTEKGTDKLTFTPANTAAVYIVTAVMAPLPDDPEGEDIHVSKTFKTEANGVVAVTCPQGEKVRPGTTMTFTATELTYDTLVQDFETAAIKWQLNGRDVGSGRSITLDGRQYFSAPGSYVVEAYVVKANAWNDKTNKPASDDEKDDWRFKVKYNEVTGIEGPTAWVAGKKYNFRAVTDMPYDPQKDGNIDWKTPNGTGFYRGEFLRGAFLKANQKGQITASLPHNAKPITLNVAANYAVIERWCFTDEKGVYKSRAGWGEVLTAVIRCKEAAGEKVNIHLLEYDSANDSNYIKDLGEVTFDAEGIAKATFRTDDIKKKLNELYFESTYYDVYFGILKKDEGIRFADMKTKEAAGKKFLFPSKESSQRDRETAKYVYINGYKELVDVKFFDAGGYPAYRIYKYGEKITIHIQTRNLAKEKFIYQMWENRNTETDILIQESSFTVGENELTVLDLYTERMKPKNKADEVKVRLFYLILKHPETHKIVYPQQQNDVFAFNPANVNYYVHLKLSSDIKLNEALNVIAPVVLGEPLEREEKKECVCQQYDLFWGNKFSCEERKKIIEISKRLSCNPNFLTSAIALETGGTFNPSIVNKLDYTGLIQIGHDAAADINRRKGTKITAGQGGNLAKMSKLEQLIYVEYYLEPFKGRLNTLVDFYLAILMPVDCGKGSQRDHVVFDRDLTLDYGSNGKVIKNIKWIRKNGYAANPAFHKEGKNENGKTYVWEIAESIEGWYNRGKINKQLIFVCRNASAKSGKSNWHDPIDNPEITLFNYYGNYKPEGSSFGLVRNGGTKNHQGLDIFAPMGTPVKACLKGKVVLISENAGGFGKFIVIQVKKEDLDASRIEYTLQYTGEKEKGDNYGDSDDRFLRYGHLSEIFVTDGQEVEAGEIIGKSGNTGNALDQSVKARHLHFEITDAKSAGSGLSNRENPAFYVRLKTPDRKKQENNTL